MFLCLQLTIGLREQNTLALSFMLLWITMLCGLATESWSRPAERGADGYRGWCGDPKRTPEVLYLIATERAWLQRGRKKAAPRPTSTMNMTNAERYAFTRQCEEAEASPAPLCEREKRVLSAYRWAYVRNYATRMLPHAIGFFTYIPPWVVFFNHFGQQLADLRVENEDLFARVPDFVPWAVGTTFVWFSLFTFVQWRYQYVSPDFYWKTEIWYCALSLGSKLTLGSLLYVSVLMYSSFAEALNDTPANAASG